MNWRDFLPLAARLATGTTEADWRSAVSRAYYAVFHGTRDLLTGFGFKTPRADQAHEYLYRRLNNSGLAAVQQAAAQFRSLRQVRNQADYDMNRPCPKAVAATQLRVAHQILQTLDALSPAERTQVTDAMKLYEHQIGDVTWHP